MDQRPRKMQRQITTFVTPPYDALDRMLALVRRFRKKNLDIFYKIWSDVLSDVFHMRLSINNGRVLYIPRQYILNTFVSPPKPPIWTYVSNPDE